jgi:signal transduction histidine kinase
VRDTHRWRVWFGWLGAVRIRAAVAAALVVGAALALSGFATVSLLRGSLYANATNTARAEASDLSYFVTKSGTVPPRLPISDEEMATQIVNRRGVVLASSRNVVGQAPMASLQPGPGRDASLSAVVLHVLPHTHVNLDLDSRFVVVATGLATGSTRATVLVANSLGAADHAVDLVALALVLAVPMLMLLVGFLVWWFMGRSLRPVELIRAEVAELSATDLSRRVSEPPTFDEIGRLARTMNAMLARLEYSNARQRQLVADVSHELRNPLASMRTQLEVAVAHPGPENIDLVQGAIAEVTRTSQLVEDLLTLARFDERSAPVRLGEVDLDDVVFDIVDTVRALGAVEVSALRVGAVRILGDGEQLRRLVMNLATNAARHARTKVSFELLAREEFAYLSVSDDGPGVPASEREHVFERFVRLDGARAYQGGGVGLGLAIVREIANAHGGRVWIEGADPGARFVVRLPCIAVPVDDAQEDLGVETKPTSEAALSSGSQVVDRPFGGVRDQDVEATRS